MDDDKKMNKSIEEQAKEFREEFQAKQEENISSSDELAHAIEESELHSLEASEEERENRQVNASTITANPESVAIDRDPNIIDDTPENIKR